MKRKAKLYGPVLLAALLCALVFATGALKKPKMFENITTDYKAVLDASARGRIPPQMGD